MKAANLALRFLLELGALAALGSWGFQVGSSDAVQWILGIGTPLVAAVIWGLFVAPRRRFDVPFVVWILLQVLIFGAAVLALFASGRSTFAVVFAALVVINASLMIVWNQRGDATDLEGPDVIAS
jgi:hypothetical protein